MFGVRVRTVECDMQGKPAPFIPAAAGRTAAAECATASGAPQILKRGANLKFLVGTGLIINYDRIEKSQAFLEYRPAGGGPALPAGQSQTSLEQMLQLM